MRLSWKNNGLGPGAAWDGLPYVIGQCLLMPVVRGDPVGWEVCRERA
jgi:hypothetical protein